MNIKLLLIPYTCFSGIQEILNVTFPVELLVDICMCIQIILGFITAFQDENDTVTHIPSIALNHLKTWLVPDLVATLPCMITFYNQSNLDYYVYWPYLLRIISIYKIFEINRIFKTMLMAVSLKIPMSKQTIYKLTYFFSILLSTVTILNITAGGFVYVGNMYSGTWINHPVFGLEALGFNTDRATIYITAVYWAVTTLATVGYGDVKGFRTEEYVYVMIVEFVGILFFSFIMGAITNVFTSGEQGDMMEERIENVDIWLVKIDGARQSKQLPKILYDKIKDYIKDMILYDHKKLIDGYQFFYQLTPQIRFELCKDLFSRFINKEFPHLFKFEFGNNTLECADEFTSILVSQLYCRVFIPNQTIIKRGETFPEMYMIFQGNVVLSLYEKDKHEFFNLYPTNYFGDYQILFGLRANECYKSSASDSTYCHCIKKRNFLQLIKTFPNEQYIFMKRGELRRREFRRIKKQFMTLCKIDPDPEQDKINLEDQSKFKIVPYTDLSSPNELPDFLVDPNFYFRLQIDDEQDQEAADHLSEAEIVEEYQGSKTRFQKQKNQSLNQLRNLINHVDMTNKLLANVKIKINEDAEKVAEFIDQVRQVKIREMPQMDNLQSIVNELQVIMLKLNAI